MPEFPVEDLEVLFVENVGHLVGTASFVLGAQLQVVVATVPEGHTKPYHYPPMFAGADAIMLNKVDLLPCFVFGLAYF